ncbi:MAG: NADH:flavin oxidoreductase/NADH oxidase [Alphaproteobacteria bacterium]
MTEPLLFTPVRLGPLHLANRIAVSPMCQYSAVEGSASDWHLMHLGQFATGGAGLIIVEATGVLPEGRISPACLGLWSDANEAALKPALAFVRRHSAARIAIQLGHAGRKGSGNLPWRGGGPIMPDAPGGWRTVAPSPLPFDSGWPAPMALDQAGLERVKDGFARATRRALRLGFDAIELHGAHGYLIHQFLSPLSNRRDDAYGGSLDNRLRFPLELFDAVRALWPANRALGIRVSASDWVDGGWELEQTIQFAMALKARGCDFIDVSSGGSSPAQQIPLGPGYQVPFAEAVRRETGLATLAVGMITGAQQAEDILQAGQADMVCLARALLWDPHWPWHAAAELGATAPFPPQYARAHPSLKGPPTPADY